MDNKYIQNLEEEFEQNNFEEFKELDEKGKLCALYAYYHYFSADSSKLDEVLLGIVKNSNSFIRGIFIDTEADVETIDVLVANVNDSSDFNISASLAEFKYAEEQIFNEKNGEISNFFSDPDHKPSVDRPIKIKTLTFMNPKTMAVKKSIKNGLNITVPSHEFISFEYLFWSAIENEILEIEDPKEFVTEGYIKMDNIDNVLRFGNEESIIVNASALSIKNLYDLYSYRGLFSQNLRYYISNPKIDDNIIDTILTRSDNFWYYNNGIIIICDDYKFENGGIVLKNFSIINGGQTSYLIGDTDFSRDFFVQCKIVKNKYVTDKEKVEFIANVAEATNTQKPIKSKDLIANQKEQRFLKKQLADAKIFCSIKRGQKVNKKLYPEPWQNTTNEELAQFLYSFLYQNPGLAKSSKSQLCSNPDKYSLIFTKQYDSLFLKDLLLLKQYYKKWARNIASSSKKDSQINSIRISESKYCMLYTIAVFGLLVKNTYHPEYKQKYRATDMPEMKMEILSQFDINHSFLKENVSQEKIFSIFDFCADIIIEGFQYLREFKPNYNSIANFSKLNSNYTSYVVKNLMYKILSPLPGNLDGIWKEVLHERTQIEIDEDNQLLDLYKNLLSTELKYKTKLARDITEELKEELTNYRTKTYKANHIKAYEIFKNKSRDIIAMYGASTIEELKDLNCLDAQQIKEYGVEILKVIQKVMSRH